MSTKIIEISLPKFIHCENEPKTGDLIHDNRQFIYCPEYLSLIEIIPLDTYQIQYSMDLPQKNFVYKSDKYEYEEEFLVVLVQNNIEQVNQSREIEHIQNKTQPLTSEQMLNDAWDYYLNYLKWEDQEL